MFAASSLSEGIPAGARQPRADGGVRVSFRRTGGVDRLADCLERDGYKIRFPKVHFPKTGALEGVIVNTGGGVAGGDRVRHGIALGEGARVTISTPSAERIYRSLGAPSQIEVSMRLEAGASLAWLPQETILYNRASLSRRFDIDMAADASLLMAEITVFGRKEMGETLGDALYLDRWRVRRAGLLAFAENIRFEGDLHASLQKAATGNGARICATVLFVAPAAEDRLEAVRAAISGAESRIAASAWNGLLCIRCLGTELEAVRCDLVRAIQVLRPEPMPRVWGT
jgi:urease accessory protein